MINMENAITPKSDQLNNDDLIAGSKTIKITSVKVKDGEQPVSIFFEGDNGKPWKPCKSMCRVLVAAWGKDGESYIGRYLTLYADGSVRWAGQEVGGIRISHMSNIEKPLRIMLTVSRGKRSKYEVLPLTVEENAMTEKQFNEFSKAIKAAQNMAELAEVAKAVKDGKFDQSGKKKIGEVYQCAVAAIRDAEQNKQAETQEKKEGK